MAPAGETSKILNSHGSRGEEMAAVAPVRVRGGAAVVDSAVAMDRAVSRGMEKLITAETPNTAGGRDHARIGQKRPHGGRPHVRRKKGSL